MLKQVTLITAFCCFFTIGSVAEEEMSIEDRLAEARKTIEEEEEKNQELREQLTEFEEEITGLRARVKELEEAIESQ